MANIRVGVIGVGRGMGFAAGAGYVGMELVALCDTWEEKLLEAGKRYDVATYTDYDKFLEHDMDAVILANYFHQHAPFAIEALEAGKHVMSETSACKTPGEGAALARAVEKSGKIYMFAENYAFFTYNQEMRRLYRAGEIGEIQYAEGEYNHPGTSEFKNRLSPGLNHWRNHLPPTYYCTHAMSPIMYVTDTRPVSINALSIPQSEQDTERLHVKTGDFGFVAICRMDNGSVARLMGLTLRGEGIWYRFHGSRGLMENLRTGDRSSLRIVHEEWDRREGDVGEKIYAPDFPVHADLARRAGHGGGDFFTNYFFAEAIRKNEQPYLDVYRGLEMTLVGIQGWRSCLENGAPFEIPDFRREEVRKRYENDDWSPFPEDRRPGQPWPSIKGKVEPSPEAVAYARQIWEEMGHQGL
ncbi:MAG: Gfo/Idh/MocA family oxidoreductase [Armatimonadetes bacterium]|nr:Gfo/Idh/MocA family oxidoreductase [Armatimonadota bacterium]